MQKLKCVIIDDHHKMLSEIGALCERSTYIQKIYKYNSPIRFLKDLPSLDADVCLLDISMPEIDGFKVAQKMKGVRNMPIIFMTIWPENFKEALDIGTIDVLPKPFTLERLNIALKKAMLAIADEKVKNEYALFYVAETKGQVKIKTSDIVYVGTDTSDHRNKYIYLRSGEKYTLMDCTLPELLTMSNNLVQVNKSSLISPDIFNKLEFDQITLDIKEREKPLQTTLSRKYRAGFKEKFESR